MSSIVQKTSSKIYGLIGKSDATRQLVTKHDFLRSKIFISRARTTPALPRKLFITVTSPLTLATLYYDKTYWEARFPQDQLKGLTMEGRLHLVFSLMIYLSVNTRQLMYWLFTTEIPAVTQRVGHFMGFFSTESTLEAQFGPAMLFGLWRDSKRWPRAQAHIREMTIPCAHELALEDSDRVISNPFLRVRLKTLTIAHLRNLLHPTKLVELVKELAPFTWGLLHTFCASANRSRKQRKKNDDEPMPDAETDTGDDDWADDPNDDPNTEAGDADPASAPKHGWSQDYPGFSRNPVFVRALKALYPTMH